MERGQWLDILIALIEYLRSGESKVGFLNKAMRRKMLDKGVEDEVGKTGAWDGDVVGKIPNGEVETEGGAVLVAEGMLRRSSRKRGLVNVEQEARDTKFRRKG